MSDQSFEVIECNVVLDVPPEVRLCPHCGSKLTVIFECWQADENGWAAVSANVNCSSEPDIDVDEWDEWAAEHFQTPYLYWLPVETVVLEWVNKRYRFNCKGSDGEIERAGS